MIKSLTPQQEAKLPIYAQKWLDIGLSTEPCNVTQTKRWINKAYQQAGLEPPKEYKLFDSPLSCARYPLLEAGHNYSWQDSITKRVSNRIDDVRKNVRVRVMGQVSDQVYNQVRDKIWYPTNQIHSQVKDLIWDRIYTPGFFSNGFPFVWDSLQDQLHGNHDAYWLGYYDFFLKELKLDCVKPLIPLINIAKHCGWWVLHWGIYFIQHRPKEIHLNKDNQLHMNGGPALSYRDGFSLWRLNGVEVPQWLAETREEDIDPRKLLEIDNAQVRAEFVRKVGIERVCYSLKAKCVDKRDGYELLMLDLGDGRRRPYLRMQNPSVPELWHVEGVHPDCSTVSEALKWRNGGETEAPTVLT